MSYVVDAPCLSHDPQSMVLASACITLPNGEDLVAEIESLSPTSISILTKRRLTVNKRVTVTFYSVSVEGIITIVAQGDVSIVGIQFDPDKETRALIEGLIRDMDDEDLDWSDTATSTDASSKELNAQWADNSEDLRVALGSKARPPEPTENKQLRSTLNQKILVDDDDATLETPPAEDVPHQSNVLEPETWNQDESQAETLSEQLSDELRQRFARFSELEEALDVLEPGTTADRPASITEPNPPKVE